MPLRHVRLFVLKALAGPPTDRTMQPITCMCMLHLYIAYMHPRCNAHVRLFVLKALAGPPADRTTRCGPAPVPFVAACEPYMRPLRSRLNGSAHRSPLRCAVRIQPCRRGYSDRSVDRAGRDCARTQSPDGLSSESKARTYSGKKPGLWVTKPGRVWVESPDGFCCMVALGAQGASRTRTRGTARRSSSR